MIQPIGIIHSPFKQLENMPIQPKGAQEILGQVELFPDFAAGLKDLEGFSHIYLITHFHKAQRESLTVVPFMDDVPRGVFATRSPLRPNHIGLSIVELVEVNENVVTIKGVDVLDGTPLLDIKPYIARFDHVNDSRSGWMQASAAEVKNKRSDTRFV
ncbi:MAG: tRNA (N6-threonylcarbamoyladenosine(37)-N6)-methyltransferase TrmO [Chloroflexi bacterium]|nr:MAG: tRNA (N6-threonylcarbamoyladenosine(37)-N6)-methyltransferase TrmO [Chloroflexota bacterium]